MAINWTPLVRLRGGKIGRYIGRCAVTGKHRVQTYATVRGEYIAPPDGDIGQYSYTTWLLSDEGRCRGDNADSPLDYAGDA